MDNKRFKIVIWVMILLVFICGVLFCVNGYHVAKEQKDEVAKKQNEIEQLEKQLEDVEKEYSSSLRDALSSSYDVSVNRVKRDEKMIKEILMKSFEYKDFEEYNENRAFVANYISEDTKFMKEYFLKDISSDDGGDDSFLKVLDIKRKCKLCDVYYTDKNEEVYNYLAHVKSIPYYGDDINRSSHMHSDQYLITVAVDESGKILNFDYSVCYID